MHGNMFGSMGKTKGRLGMRNGPRMKMYLWYCGAADPGVFGGVYACVTDAGYDLAIDTAHERGVDLPMVNE